MKRKNYIKPTMCVVNLKQQGHLLTGSDLSATRRGYDSEDEETWE